MHRERHLWGEYVLDIRRAVEAHMHRGVRCHQDLLVLYVGARGPDGFFMGNIQSSSSVYV